MTIDSFTIADPRTAPTAAQIARPSKEANHKPKSVMLGKPMKTIADVKVANAKGQISLGLERFSSRAPARTATVTKTLYGKIKIAENPRHELIGYGGAAIQKSGAELREWTAAFGTVD